LFDFFPLSLKHKHAMRTIKACKWPNVSTLIN
jgi:hypothetical protein